MSNNRAHEQKKGLFYNLIVIAYVGLMTIAFYVSAERRGIIPALPTILRYACDAGVIGLAIVYYLVTYMQNRLRVALDLAWIWSVPYIGMSLISLMIWIIERASLNYISRGLINVGCAELTALAVACAIWLFGEDSINYTFYGAAGGVMLVALRAIMDYGPGGFFGQYIALLLTFADNTGPAMRYMEFHDLGQGLGLFVMYYAWMFLHKKRNYPLLIASFVCFTLSLKRIDVVAIIVSMAVGWFMDKLTYRRRWYFIIAFEMALIVFAYVYLVIIKLGYYGIIMEKLGIDTMSRDIIYNYYAGFYEFSPTFLGKGLRYVYVHMLESDEKIRVSRSVYLGVINAHNEYITYMIEMGFWGFIFWLWSNSWYRFNAIRRQYGWEAMTLTLMIVLYSYLSYASDNTYFYFSINYVGFITSGVTVLSSRTAQTYELELANT